MAHRGFEKKPLYRRVNRTTHRAPCGHGGQARWRRNTKAEKADDRGHAGMGPKHRHGLDYAPLFKFLLSKVGQDWDAVHSEAVSRLDKEEPIYWLVAKSDAAKQPIVRVGESTYYSGLWVDETGRLARVAPELGPEHIYPTCPCCTFTFNGQRVPNAFDPSREHETFKLLSGFQ